MVRFVLWKGHSGYSVESGLEGKFRRKVRKTTVDTIESSTWELMVKTWGGDNGK